MYQGKRIIKNSLLKMASNRMRHFQYKIVCNAFVLTVVLYIIDKKSRYHYRLFKINFKYLTIKKMRCGSQLRKKMRSLPSEVPPHFFSASHNAFFTFSRCCQISFAKSYIEGASLRRVRVVTPPTLVFGFFCYCKITFAKSYSTLLRNC